jgi:DNA-binding CsgD family transcriptional regulator
MDFMTAIEWVGKSGKRIRRKIKTYRIYAPYEDKDFLQEAYLSALLAVHRSAGKGIAFEAAFWTIFTERLGKMTPNSESNSGSNSIPSHLCDTEIESIDIAWSEPCLEPDIEAIYFKLNRYLTRREQLVLRLALGITHVGRLSNYEIASHLGCRESNVRDALNRALDRVRDLVRSGRVVPEELVRSEDRMQEWRGAAGISYGKAAECRVVTGIAGQVCSGASASGRRGHERGRGHCLGRQVQEAGGEEIQEIHGELTVRPGGLSRRRL